MADINFHKPYKGKNDYTYRIQELYKYQNLLKTITKELHKILKQDPEYKNKNNTIIKNDINEITNMVYVKNPNFMKILENIQKRDSKSKTYLPNLYKARKILLERIPILEKYINTLPVPQNNNETNNQEPNNYPYFPKSKPKQKERITYISEKDGKKAKSKLLRERNLGRSTFLNNNKQMKEEKKEKNREANEAYEAEVYNNYLREEQEKQERQWKNYNHNYNYRYNNNNNYIRYGPIMVRNGIGYRALWGDDARAYNDGLWNKIR